MLAWRYPSQRRTWFGLFPGMFVGPLDESIVKRARAGARITQCEPSGSPVGQRSCEGTQHHDSLDEIAAVDARTCKQVSRVVVPRRELDR